MKQGLTICLSKWLCIFLLMLLAADARAQTKEYEIKAVFLLNFAQFTAWPTNAFADDKSPLVIGVLGDDPFGNVLELTVKNESWMGRKIVVKRFSRANEVKNCQVLFITQSEAGRLSRIISQFKDRQILTVSDIADAADKGVCIQIYTRNNKLRLKINLNAVKNENLTLSSKLLRVADVMSP
ncbi:MAG TPA: YfiR family protein [Verrucomicrobiae bacterium]|nr:YfiR family protein [Verrucomicrobiae bacterium]